MSLSVLHRVKEKRIIRSKTNKLQELNSRKKRKGRLNKDLFVTKVQLQKAYYGSLW